MVYMRFEFDTLQDTINYFPMDIQDLFKGNLQFVCSETFGCIVGSFFDILKICLHGQWTFNYLCNC